MTLYVETRIRADLDAVWHHTQTPSLHTPWDLRFTDIEYLPRPDETEPQRFLYATRLGFGLRIEGRGETRGERHGDGGERTSALKFRSDDRKSLIREGSGYWRYVPTDDGVRFLTGYDYRVRFGVVGRLFDRLVFRPLIGWATAWSFDRLRLWLERGVHPASAMRAALVHGIARLGLAFVWVWHGLVPKLLHLHPDELAMVRDAGIRDAALVSQAIGVAEIALGLATLVAFRSRWPLYATLVLMLVATVGVSIHSPRFLVAAFNPVSLNVLMAALAAVALVALRDVPSAARCLRKPEGRP